MAALQVRDGSYRVIVTYRGRQHAFTLGKVTEAEARAKAGQVDYLLMRLRQGLIAPLSGAAERRHRRLLPA